MGDHGPIQQLLDCMISSWYPRFARVTFKTVVLPLPQPVVDWLVSDGLHLPEDTQAFATRAPADQFATEDDYREWSSEEEGEAGSSSDAGSAAAAQPPPPELAELQARLAAAIEKLGGRVVPKLSWSCPKDAVWISPSSSLCCTNADEVLLLLRSSDRVAHDVSAALEEARAAAGAAGAAAVGDGSAAAAAAAGAAAEAAAGSTAASAAAGSSEAAGSQAAAYGSQAAAEPSPAHPVQHCLALRKWYDLQPGREFRCFVRNQRLVGACQRDLTQCFEWLREGGERAAVGEAVAAFHAKHVQGRFPHPDYTYDVYVASSGSVRLVDFNPVGGTTSPLLFTWSELRLAGEGGAEGGQGAEGSAEGSQSAEGSAEGGQSTAQGSGQGGAVAAPGTSAAADGECGSSCCGQQAVGREVGEEAGGGEGGEEPGSPSASYLEQLRRVQALSLDQGQQQQQQYQEQQQQQSQEGQQQPGPGSAAAGGAASGASAAAAGSPSGSAPASSTACAASQEFELRVIEEAVALRPTTMAYGVPFDFVDSSEGSALDRLMQQAQQAGAGELSAALARQGGGGEN